MRVRAKTSRDEAVLPLEIAMLVQSTVCNNQTWPLLSPYSNRPLTIMTTDFMISAPKHSR